jgi:hypothetical protein
MFVCILGLVFGNLGNGYQVFSEKPKNANSIFVLSKNLTMPFVTQDFFGSIDTNQEGQISFYHLPKGFVKPAVLYVHPVVFKNKLDQKNILRFVGKNVRIKGEIIIKNGQEFLSVTQIEGLILGDKNATPY